MAGSNWLASEHTDVAAERILDAAGELFAQRPVTSVGMHEIAKAANCSRATVYRYFENRGALRTAYAHREAQALNRELIAALDGIDDPRQRLVVAVTTTLALVRDSPALLAWFSSGDAPVGAELADRSDLIKTMVAAFLLSLGRPGPAASDPAAVDRRARWLVRILTSLLQFPGRDADDERAMIEEFLAPLIVPAAR